MKKFGDLNSPTIAGICNASVPGMDFKKEAITAVADASGERFRAMADQAPVLIWVADLSTQCLWFNKPWLDFVGRSLEEELRSGWAEHVHADDLDGCMAALTQALAARAPFQREYRLRRHDGQYRWMLDRGVPGNGLHGEFTGYIGSCFDITERKQREAESEEVARRNEAQMRLMDATLSSITDLAYTFDLEGNWIYANKPLLELWGRRLEDIVGKSSLQLGYPPELAERLRLQVKQVISTRRPFKGETFFTDAAGIEDYHEYIFSPVFAADGSISAVTGTTRLVTERKRSEQNATFLSQLSDKLTKVSDATEINRIAVRELGEFLQADRCYFCEWKEGLSRIEIRLDWHAENIPSLAGLHDLKDFGPPEWIDNLQTKGIAIGDVFVQRLATEYLEGFRRLQIRAYATSGFRQQDSAIVTVSVTSINSRKWREDELTVLENVVARVWPLIERARSEQSLRESEEQLRLALSAADLGHWRWDAATDIIVLSDRTAAIYGVPSGLQVTRTEMREILAPEDRERARLMLRRSIETNTEYDIEYRLNRPIGKERWIAARGRPTYGSEGKLTGMLGVALDISKRKQAAAALEESQAKLEEHARDLELRVAERTAKLQETIADLESFSYSISHDLRAPLRAMEGFARILADDCGPKVGDDGKDYIRRIVTSANRMDRLIQDILVFSKVARTDLELHEVDLELLVRGILESYPQFASAKENIEIIGSLPPVLGNEAALTQCVSNLLGNALKFLAPGVRPEIKIWAAKTGDLIRLSIQDNGIGIKPEAFEKIFVIFQQLDKNYEGTGIGLAIVRKAIERMGGQIGVKSEPGRGSTFWLELKTPTAG